MLSARDRNAILDVLHAAPIINEVQAWLDRRPGPTPSISVALALFTIIVSTATNSSSAVRLDKCAGILRNAAAATGLPLPKGIDLDRIDDLPPAQAKLERRKVYRRLRRTLKAIARWGRQSTDGVSNLQRLNFALCSASTPEHARTYNSYIIDSAGVQAAYKYAYGVEKLTDHLYQAAMRRRTYRTDDGDTIVKDGFGFGIHATLRFDPLQPDTVYIAAVTLTPGSTSEINVALEHLQFERDHINPIGNLFIADRAYTQSPRIHQHLRSIHADPVMDLKATQGGPTRTTSGIWAIGGGAYDPATPPHLRNYARRKQHENINTYLEQREAALGPYRLPHHTPPDIHGTHRYQGNCERKGADCPLRPIAARPNGPIYTHHPTDGHQLPLCQGSTVTLTPDDYDHPTTDGTSTIHNYQAFPYGTYEHAAVYHTARNHIEAILGTLTEHHGLWGGRHGFKIHRFDILQLFAIAAAVARNLVSRGYFPPEHGTDNCRDDTVLVVPDEHRKSLHRALTRRAHQRADFNPATCPQHTHQPATPISTHGTDPPHS